MIQVLITTVKGENISTIVAEFTSLGMASSAAKKINDQDFYKLGYRQTAIILV
jgi:hypothetical protein